MAWLRRVGVYRDAAGGIEAMRALGELPVSYCLKMGAEDQSMHTDCAIVKVRTPTEDAMSRTRMLRLDLAADSALLKPLDGTMGVKRSHVRHLGDRAHRGMREFARQGDCRGCSRLMSGARAVHGGRNLVVHDLILMNKEPDAEGVCSEHSDTDVSECYIFLSKIERIEDIEPIIPDLSYPTLPATLEALRLKLPLGPFFAAYSVQPMPCRSTPHGGCR